MFRYVNLRSIIIFLFLVITLILGIQPTQASHANSTQWPSISGRFIKDPSGNNVILRGVSLVDVSVANLHTRHANALIDLATDYANGWYARVIRLPIYPDAIDG